MIDMAQDKSAASLLIFSIGTVLGSGDGSVIGTVIGTDEIAQGSWVTVKTVRQ